MNSGRNGAKGKWLAAALVGMGVIGAIVGYFVRPLKPRPAATQPVAVEPSPPGAR